MNASKKVFIVGPGFIGWNVLDLLCAEGYTVSGLVRRELHGQQIQKSGALAIQGDLNDRELIKKHVAQNDVSHVMALSLSRHISGHCWMRRAQDLRFTLA